MKISEFLTSASRRLRDTGELQWERSDLIEALNAAFVGLCNHLPDCHTVERTQTLVPGSVQYVEPDLHQPVDFLYNVNADESAGRPITLADRGVLDTGAPGWRSDAPRGHVRHWMPSRMERKRFDVWPPAPPDRGEAPTVPDEPVDPGDVTPGDYVADAFYNLEVPIPQLELVLDQADVNEIADSGDASVASAGFNGIDEDPSQRRYFYATIQSAYSGLDDAVRISTLVRANVVFNTNSPQPLLDTDENLNAAVQSDDARLSVDSVIRVERRASDNSNWYIASDQTQGDGITQAVVDQYFEDLEDYTVAVEAFAAWEAAAPIQIHGVFCQVPIVSQGVVGVCGPEVIVPDEPVDPGSDATVQEQVDYALALNDYYDTLYAKWLRDAACDGTLPDAPVDPGELGDGAEVTIPLTTSHTRDGGAQQIIDTNDQVSGSVVGLTFDFIYDTSNWSSGSLNIYATRQVFITTSTYPDDWDGNVSGTLNVDDEDGNALLRDNDRLYDGAILRVTVPSSGNVVLVGIDIRDNGTTQVEIDQYNADLTAYNAAVAAVSTLEEGSLTEDSEFPINQFYMQALFEYFMYYSYLIDDDISPNSNRANQHFQSFQTLTNAIDGVHAEMREVTMEDDR